MRNIHKSRSAALLERDQRKRFQERMVMEAGGCKQPLRTARVMTSFLSGLLLVLILEFHGLAVDRIPQPQGVVSDFARVLTAAEKQSLQDKILRLKQETGFEITVATVETSHGEPPFDYSLRMIRQWGVGDKERGGVLFVVYTRDRQISVRVSNHAEATIPNERAAQARDAASHTSAKGSGGRGSTLVLITSLRACERLRLPILPFNNQ